MSLWAQWPNPIPQSRPSRVNIGGLLVMNPSDEQLTSAGWYPVDYAALLEYQQHAAPELIAQRIVYAAEDMPLDDARTQCRAMIAEERYTAEVGGMLWTQPSTVQTYGIATDDRSQSKVTGAKVQAESNPTYTVPAWKCAEPSGALAFIALENADIIDLGNSLAAFVGSLFEREKVLNQQIDEAATVGDLRAVIW